MKCLTNMQEKLIFNLVNFCILQIMMTLECIIFQIWKVYEHITTSSANILRGMVNAIPTHANIILSVL